MSILSTASNKTLVRPLVVNPPAPGPALRTATAGETLAEKFYLLAFMVGTMVMLLGMSSLLGALEADTSWVALLKAGSVMLAGTTLAIAGGRGTDYSAAKI